MLLDTYLSAHYKLWIVLRSHGYKIAVRYTVYSLSRCHAKTTYSTLRCYHYRRLNISRKCKRTLILKTKLNLLTMKVIRGLSLTFNQTCK